MKDMRSYAVVTSAYWGFTLTDGALRMLVLLHFHSLGYSPFQLATLFLLYELMGMVTNLIGGWVGSRFGLKLTLFCGLCLQIFALLMLSALDTNWPQIISVLFVLATQGLSGVAKDLSKMSSKSAIKLFVPEDAHSKLFQLVSLLTGSKNALKGLGFFLGGLLLTVLGFAQGLWLMATFLSVVLVAATLMLPRNIGKAESRTEVKEIFAKSRAINLLSGARIFLFGARDVWFVVALPVFLYDVLNWSFTEVGSFLAVWIVGYGAIQGFAPAFVKSSSDGRSNEIRAARLWIFILALVTFMITLMIRIEFEPFWTLFIGLAIFGFCFAINSSLHSYLILALSSQEKIALSVGFYYSANATGRLLGTIISGIAYQWGGLAGALGVAASMLAFAGVFTILLGYADQTSSSGTAKESL